MADLLERDRAALNRALSALTELHVNLSLISEHLKKVQRDSRFFNLHFDLEDRFVGMSHKRDPIVCHLATSQECFEQNSHCEWLQKHLESLLERYLEADNAILALPSRLVEKLDGVTQRPWIASVRCYCLDNIMKWPGEMSHQTSLASEKMLGSIEDMLKKAEKYDPFETWAGFIKLIYQHGHELYAIRHYVFHSPQNSEDGNEEPIIDDLVTLDQVAPLTGLTKRSLERYLKSGEIPQPDIQGGGGKSHKWYWATLREALSKISGRPLPEKFPGSRII